MMLLVLLGCPAGTDTAPTHDSGDTADSAVDTDSGGDTAVQAERSLAAAGIQVTGMSSSATGNAVAGPGDLDGDGVDDLVVTAYYIDRSCVWLGPVAAGGHGLDDADACWSGEATYDYSGYSIAPAGDLTGDGRPDVLIGAIGNDDAGAFAGKIYVVTGDARGTTSLSEAAAAFTGEAAGDYAGYTPQPIGDVDGDGDDDAVVGAPGAVGGKGRAYLLLGPIEPGTHPLADSAWIVTGDNDGTSSGGPPPPHGETASGDRLGDGTGGGDLDGDGIADLAVGATCSDRGVKDAGATGVFYGPLTSGSVVFSDADTILTDPTLSDFSGDPLRVADLDGDGRGDLAVGADGGTGGTLRVFTALAPGETSTDTATIVLTAEASGDEGTKSFDIAGDLDGNGAVDLAIGAPSNDHVGTDAGAVYLFLGPLTAGTRGFADADVRWRAEAEQDGAGRAVAAGGDVDADGVPDLLIGATFSDGGGAFSGRAYVVEY